MCIGRDERCVMNAREGNPSRHQSCAMSDRQLPERADDTSACNRANAMDAAVLRITTPEHRVASATTMLLK